MAARNATKGGKAATQESTEKAKAPPASEQQAPATPPSDGQGGAQAAAQEVAPSPGILITGLELESALEFLAPDQAPEQLQQALVIELRAALGDEPGGLYVYHAEHPEEGSILLEGGIAPARARADEAVKSTGAAVTAFQAPGSRALCAVLAERARQIESKGYTAERDAQYRNGELAMGAACYAVFAAGQQPNRSVFSWPFATAAFRPHDKRRAMVKAAAMLLASIEALDLSEVIE